MIIIFRNRSYPAILATDLIIRLLKRVARMAEYFYDWIIRTVNISFNNLKNNRCTAVRKTLPTKSIMKRNSNLIKKQYIKQETKMLINNKSEKNSLENIVLLESNWN
jgi:hypothetical protein